MHYSDFLELEPYEIIKKWTAEVVARMGLHRKWLLSSGIATGFLPLLVLSYFNFSEQAQIHLIFFSLAGCCILVLYLILQFLSVLEVWILKRMLSKE